MSAPPVWAIRTLTQIHLWLHTLSGGRLFNQLNGDEVCFVTMRGARSGRTLTVPLMYVPYNDGLLLVASQGGNPRNPAWYHNLRANPDITVTWRGQRKTLVARLAAAEEKAALWPICDAHYAPFADYRGYTSRDIPIFVCEPAPDAGTATAA